ncbi:MAG: LLM class flavin-dependent oxidoreductase [SAR202 cluster bacterium]|nr:LLM class flavin-dependent oxidoreductase [SAR202 cluster bacterium]
MKFAVLSHIPWPESRDQRLLVEETLQQVQHAEELGFCSAWLAEHHFSRYGLGSSSLVVLSNIAARTKKIRLGTAVLLPPLHHPLRLAEDTATLDVLSGGRLDVGFGRGTEGYEYRGYHQDWEESQARFQESIKMILGLWTHPEYTCHGQYFHLDKAVLVPSPLQKPHPPVYIAATRTPATMAFVAASGFPTLVGPVADHSEASDLCRRFVDQSAEAGSHVPASKVPFFRYVYLAENEKQARKDAEGPLTWTMDMLQFRRQSPNGGEVHRRMAEWQRTRADQPTSYDHLVQHRAIVGTPEQCIATIQKFRDQGVEYFGCNFAFGGLEHRKVMRSMDLFAREVMPRLQD